MNKKNNTKNTFKPAYVVDITMCEDLYDTALAFATAKQKAGIPLSDENIDIICTAAVDASYKEKLAVTPIINVVSINEKPVKKENIFKRFWKWVKRIFTR